MWLSSEQTRNVPGSKILEMKLDQKENLHSLCVKITILTLWSDLNKDSFVEV